VWLARLFSEITLLPEFDDPICLHTDNQSAIRLAKNPEHVDKTKHIDIRHNYIISLVDTNQISLKHISDTFKPVDILTKSVVKANVTSQKEKSWE